MTIFVPALTRRGFVWSAISAVSATRLLRAQQKDSTFSTDVKVVNVFASVRDKHGTIVQYLIKDDFALLEDGRPQVIKYFSKESNLPLTLGLLVDTSLSQRRVLGEEQMASQRFFQQVLREDKDKAFVIHFDREVELLQDLTSSRKELDAALAQLELPEDQRQRGGWNGPLGRGPGGRGPGRGGPGGKPGPHGGGTSLYDSVLLASDELMKKQSGRKALVMLTDGVDAGSKVSLTSAIESAQRADTLVYSILFSDRDAYGGGGFGGRGRGGGRRPRGRQEERPDGKKILQRLSKETGGGFFEVTKKQTIKIIYDQIQEELRNQYSLGYTPEAGTGYRKIQLTVKKKDLIVQTRDGYYA
ncbi:MAG TPA: VWA domain-containing protein [Bryobacteraceae bacterium]